MSQDFYSPQEAAKKLGISTRMLTYWRLNGRIEGTRVGNAYVYTEKQLAEADTTRRKSGPKPAKLEDDEGTATLRLALQQ